MAHEATHDRRDENVFSNAQKATALIVGSVLTLIGIWGFVNGADEVLIFGVNAFHNLFHLATGLLGVAVAFVAAGTYSDEFNKLMGVTYGLLVALWLLAPRLTESLLNAGFPDAMLHLALALVFAGVGFLTHDV